MKNSGNKVNIKKEYLEAVDTQKDRVQAIKKSLDGKCVQEDVLPLPEEPDRETFYQKASEKVSADRNVLVFGALFGAAAGLILGLLIALSVIRFPENSIFKDTVFCPDNVFDKVMSVIIPTVFFSLFFLGLSVIPLLMIRAERRLTLEKSCEKLYKTALDKYYSELYKYNKQKEKDKERFAEYEALVADCDKRLDIDERFAALIKSYIKN